MPFFYGETLKLLAANCLVIQFAPIKPLFPFRFQSLEPCL